MSIHHGPRGALQWLVVAGLAIVGAVACTPSVDAPATAAVIMLTSPSVANGTLAAKHTCDGPGTSPALAWGAPPSGTQSYALIATDLDTPMRWLHRHPGVHWLIYALPATARELPEGVAQQQQLSDGTLQGKNAIATTGYAGPCPPGSASHRYAFTLHALDARPDIPPGASESELVRALRGHVIGKGQLIASFHRQGPTP
jgi:Raf kinase inhibitor-like YbhB/YbcL family protein